MKKFLKVFFLNILIVLTLFFMFDFFVYSLMSIKENNDRIYPRNFISAYVYLPIKDFELWYKRQYKKHFHHEMIFKNPGVLKHNILFREPILVDNDKAPLLFLGCSYTWGGNLSNNQTMAAKVSEASNRSAYNMGLPGWGFQQSLYMLKNSLLQRLNINPEYVIYTYIPHHLIRMVVPCSFFENSLVFYKEKNEELVLKSDLELLYWHSYISRFLYFKKNDYEAADNMPKYTKLFLKHLLEVNKLIKEHSPSSTFVVFVYEDKGAIMSLRSELEKNGIKVIFLKELSKIDIRAKENINDDAGHPSAKVWEEVAPLLAKKLNL